MLKHLSIKSMLLLTLQDNAGPSPEEVAPAQQRKQTTSTRAGGVDTGVL